MCGQQKQSNDPRNNQHNPQYANYWAPLTHKRYIPPHSAQPQHTNDWAPRTRKRHQQEHRPQRPTERSDPTQHAKGRTGDRPGPRKGATTRRNVTQGGSLHPSGGLGGPAGQKDTHRSAGAWGVAGMFFLDLCLHHRPFAPAGPTQRVDPHFPADTVWLADGGGVTATLEVQDAASGLDACSWGIGAAPGGDTHLPFRVAVQGTGQGSLSTTLGATGLALPEGVPLFLTVRCHDRAGLGAAQTLPLAVLAHAPGADAAAVAVTPDVTRSAGAVAVTWSGFHVLSPALVRYALAVGSAPDLQDVYPWTPAHDHSHAVDVGGFAQGVLWVQVRAQYPTSQSGVARRRLVIDDGAPAPGTVRHVARARNASGNVTCIPNVSRVDLQWSGFADALSEIALYEWAMVPPGEGGAPLWRARGRRTYASVPETERDPGDYAVWVRATDAAGNAALSSLVLRVDSSPPTLGPVSAYGAAGSSTIASTSEVWVNWRTALDVECGVVDYLVAIGSDPDSTTALAYASVGPAGPVRLSGLGLVHGRCYVLTLVAVNGAGLGGRAYATFCVDATPPAPGAVYVQSPRANSTCQSPDAAPVTWVASSSRVTVCADGLLDPESDTTWDATLVFGAGAEAVQVAAAPSVAPAPLAPGGAGHTFDLGPLGLTFAAGAPYVVRLRSTNAAGLTRLAATPAFYRDASPPALAWFLFGDSGAQVWGP